MTRKWVVGAMAFAILLAVPGLAFGQLSPVNRANMELAWDNVEAAAGNAIAPDADYDDNGVPERDEMGCFGELYANNDPLLTTAMRDAFDDNVAVCDTIDGALLEPTVDGFRLVIGYLTSKIGAADGESTTNVVDTIEGFTAAGGAGGIDGVVATNSESDITDGATLANVTNPNATSDFTAAEATGILDAVFDCLGIAGQTVVVAGPSGVLVGFGGTFTATTIDTDDPMFSETHTFSSSNPAVLMHVGGGVFQGVSIGTAQVIATGNTTAVVGTKDVSVTAPLWQDVCSLDDDMTTQFGLVMGVIGCTLVGPAGTNDAAEADLDGDGTKDINQLTALAYTLCDGTAGPDSAAANAIYADNLADLALLLDFYDDASDWVNGATTDTLTVTTTPASISVNTGAAVQPVSAATTDEAAAVVTGTITWTTSNAAVATVASTGMATANVTIVGEGSATISAYDNTNFGVKTTIPVTVDDPATNNVTVSGDPHVNIGETTQLTASTIGPNPAQTYTWMSLNLARATVDANGLVTGVGPQAGPVTVNIQATGSVSGVGVLQVTVHLGTVCDDAVNFKAEEEVKNATTTNQGGFSGNWNRVRDLWGATGSGGARDEVIAFGAPAAAALAGLETLINSPSVGAGIRGAVGGISALAGNLDDLGAVFDSTAGQGSMTTNGRIETLQTLNGINLLGSSAALFDLQDWFGAMAKPVDLTTAFGLLGTAPAGSTVGGVLASLEAGVTGGMDWAVLGPAGDKLDALEAACAAGFAAGFAALGVITFPEPTFEIFDESKAAGEPFDGGEVFAPGVNPFDITNEEAENFVAAAGGDNYDYVDLITGSNLFGPGSPFLPVGGALVIGILAGGLVFAGARRLGRK
jgi:hypothetical protein